MSTQYEPLEENLVITNANTDEYSIDIPPSARAVSFKCRTEFEIRFAYVTGKVGSSVSPFETVAAGQTFNLPDAMAWSGPIYFSSSEAGVVVELVGLVAPTPVVPA